MLQYTIFDPLIKHPTVAIRYLRNRSYSDMTIVYRMVHI